MPTTSLPTYPHFFHFPLKFVNCFTTRITQLFNVCDAAILSSEHFFELDRQTVPDAEPSLLYMLVLMPMVCLLVCFPPHC